MSERKLKQLRLQPLALFHSKKPQTGSINLFGPAWQGSLRGLPILHYLYHAVPVVGLRLFQHRVVPLLCLSCMCVCSSCRKS